MMSNETRSTRGGLRLAIGMVLLLALLVYLNMA
jgi:hypothetical protein